VGILEFEKKSEAAFRGRAAMEKVIPQLRQLVENTQYNAR
jgi:hypothetical protein